VTVRLLTAGPAAGAPIVLIHGWAIHSYLWRRNIPALVEAGYRVYALDLPGHGLSDKPRAPGSYTVNTMASHVLALFDALSIARATVIGHSMGGRIAIEFARMNAARVSALALLGSVGFGEIFSMVALASRVPAPRGPISTLLLRRWMVAASRAYAYGRRSSPLAEDVDAYWAATQFPDFLAAMHQSLVDFDWRPLERAAIEEIVMPALVIFGTRDRTVRPVHTSSLASLLPHGRLYWVRDAGHVANEEAPEEINRLLVEFAAQLR
jgi:pimeloyl-ACP methyl ester carboxylesterase